MNNQISSLVSSLENLFSTFNERFYDGELIKPMITVATHRQNNVLGWCTNWQAWKQGEEGYYEINIVPEHLHRPMEEICVTMLHEMVHLYCSQHEIKEVSRSNTYHNKHFKEAAKEHGLIISYNKKGGWTDSKLNDEAAEFVATLPTDMFKLHRIEPEQLPAKKKSSSKKYVCPGCHAIVRATKLVNIICEDCDEGFELEG